VIGYWLLAIGNKYDWAGLAGHQSLIADGQWPIANQQTLT
jgi:hypothetical protein